MRIGLFTDSYLPQVSGVATSIETLSDQLTKMGHQVLFLRQQTRMLTLIMTRTMSFG
jgi:1,2-diacylglycerol 3-glucosyltransferase (EC 2.4.1.157)